MNFAEVILPLPLKSTFTYSVPLEMSAQVKQGCRVVVPFGRSKFYTGIVSSVSPVGPEGYEVKDITMTLDSGPILRHPQLKLWQWVADYYMCSLGDVYKAAVPAGLKLESETFVELNPDYEEEATSPLSEREAIVVQVLDHQAKRMRMEEIERASGLKRISPVVARLMERGAVIISERLVERYRTKKEVYVAPSPALLTAEGRTEAFAAVKGARKQEAALMALLELSGAIRGNAGEVMRSRLMERAEVTAPIINALEAKGLLEIYKKSINRFQFSGHPSGTLPTLTEKQSAALDEIHRSWLDKTITLLHGVTSSGKTELYIHLADYVIRQGRQVLLLVPEIALTTQLTRRMQEVLGDKVMIYHSKFSDNERVDLWRRMLEMRGTGALVIAPRSGVFLPFDHLGLVIVDEEHDPSYKQSDPAPRYNGRDTACVLASMHGAKVLLGSATPSVETYYKALTGKYGLVSLPERYRQMPLPTISLVDLKKLPKGIPSAIAPATRSHITHALDAGNQGIIFLNRRGYAPMAVCRTCGYVPKCERCDVSLTYHRGLDKMMCHYCGRAYPLATTCPACHEHTIDTVGFGTERIEEEVQMSFPQAQIARMDLDTTRAKDAYSAIIDDFSQGRKNLLVGTQMVTKGLDFGRVQAVAVVNADAVLHYPDFRAAERAFNMIEQVAGRAGRNVEDATVDVQTYDTSNPVLQMAATHDYKAFYEYEIEERKQFMYPPFARLIYVYLKHADRGAVASLAGRMATLLREQLGTRVVGPEEPPVGRVQTLYIRRLMIRIEPTASLSKVKAVLLQAREALYTDPAMRAAKVYFDVDP